jgi:hypothetical protein
MKQRQAPFIDKIGISSGEANEATSVAHAPETIHQRTGYL